MLVLECWLRNNTFLGKLLRYDTLYSRWSKRHWSVHRHRQDTCPEESNGTIQGNRKVICHCHSPLGTNRNIKSKFSNLSNKYQGILLPNWTAEKLAKDVNALFHHWGLPTAVCIPTSFFRWRQACRKTFLLLLLPPLVMILLLVGGWKFSGNTTETQGQDSFGWQRVGSTCKKQGYGLDWQAYKPGLQIASLVWLNKVHG